MSNKASRNRRRAFCEQAIKHAAFNRAIRAACDGQLEVSAMKPLLPGWLDERGGVGFHSSGFVIPTEKRGGQEAESERVHVRMTRQTVALKRPIINIPPFDNASIQQLQDDIRHRLDGMLLGEMLSAGRKQKKEETRKLTDAKEHHRPST